MTMMIQRFAMLVVVLIVTLALAPVAQAQSESDLRKANDALRNELRDAQLKLDAANKRIRELEAQVEQLLQARASGRGSRPGGPSQDLPVSIDESIANASPRAFFSALQRSYEKAMSGIEIGTTKADDKQRANYVRVVGTWSERVNREMRDRIAWQVRVEEAIREQSGGHFLVRLIAVDPVTGTVLGDPFTVRVDRSTASRLQRLERHSDLTNLTLQGVLVPQVRVNANRLEPGPFERDLIGPFAEFAYNIDVLSLMPVEKEKPAKPPGEKPPAGSASAERQ